MPKKQKNKNRKIGRNANRCKAYKLSHTREHNKLARLAKRLLTHPHDTVAAAAVARCKATIRGF